MGSYHHVIAGWGNARRSIRFRGRTWYQYARCSGEDDWRRRRLLAGTALSSACASMVRLTWLYSTRGEGKSESIDLHHVDRWLTYINSAFSNVFGLAVDNVVSYDDPNVPDPCS